MARQVRNSYPQAFQQWWDTFRVDHPEWEGHADLLVSPPAAKEALKDYPELQSSDALSGRPTSFGVPRISLYYRLRRTGNSHRFSEMVSCQRGPALMTDVTFFQGMPQLQDQFVNDRQRERVIAIAKRHGYKPNPNDVYEPTLARFQGDPEAFVPPTGGRGYIKKICEQRGWECEGAVKTPYREPLVDPHSQNTPLAEDIVQRKIAEKIQQDPAAKYVNRQELRNQVIERHGHKYDGTHSIDEA